jgi:cobalt-zinc-cadmium efflux system membrane fusion protein
MMKSFTPRYARLGVFAVLASLSSSPPAAVAADEHGHDHAPKQAAPAARHDDPDHDHGKDEKGRHEHAHADEVKLTPEAVRRYGVRTGTARRHKLVTTFVAPGRVMLNAEATAVVGSLVSGRAVELKVRVGDAVNKGDELLVVESTELGEAQSDYLLKRAMVAGATAAVEPARGAAERARALFEKSQGISLTEVQKREADLAAARGALLTANAAADAAMNKLLLLGMTRDAVEAVVKTGKLDPRFVVRAPIAGVVIERPVTLGELVKPDREKLLVLADTSTLWVVADVPESRLREVGVGAKATVSVGAAGDPTYDGRVSYVGLSVDPATRAVPVRVEVKARPLLKPGMFAQVEIASASANGNPDAPVLAVPEGAVQTVEGKPSVFVPVPDEPNTFAPRAVGVGAAVGGLVPVTSGLNEGDRFVTAGTFILKADLGKAAAGEEGHAH